MNRTRRQSINEIASKISELLEDLQFHADEEQEYADNMPENLQYSEKHDRAEELAEMIESFCSDTQDALDDLLSEVEG